MQNFGKIATTAVEVEVIAFQNAIFLKSLVSSTKCIWAAVSKGKNSILCRIESVVLFNLFMWIFFLQYTVYQDQIPNKYMHVKYNCLLLHLGWITSLKTR